MSRAGLGLYRKSGRVLGRAVAAVAEPLEERRLLSTVYVDAAATGANSGASWADAFTTLQAALTPATSGTEIRVAGGVYTPTTSTDRAVSFRLKTGVTLYGGYAGKANANPDLRDLGVYRSILSGDIGSAGDNSDNSYHVVVGSSTTASAILDGFTISGGNANGATPYNFGGGIYSSYGNPTIRNCAFVGNLAGSASGSGGGMYNESCSPALANCVFSGNSASLTGGGVSNYFSSPTVINCTFSGNSAGSGGGIYNTSSSPKVTNCIVWGNTGGQITGGTSIITYSDIQGGGMTGGNINGDPLFIRTPSPGGDSNWGTGDDDYGDLRLQGSSPCIDVGNTAAVPAAVTTDIIGKSRFIDFVGVHDPGAIVDMGAYETAAPDIALTIASSAWEGQTALGTVTLGSTSTSTITISLVSSDTTELTIPASVVIPAGQLSANFTLTFPNDGLKDGTQTVTLTASSAGLVSTTGNAAVHDIDLDHITFDTITGPKTAGVAFAVTDRAYNIAGEVIVVYGGTATLSATGNAGTLSITPTFATFTSGVWTGNVTVNAVDANVALLATVGSVVGISNAFETISPPARVGDRVWLDTNGNGFQDSGETGLANVTVDIYSSSDSIAGNGDDVLKATNTTDANGNYAFNNLTAGVSYYLFFHCPTGYIVTLRDVGSDDSKDSDADSAGKTALLTLTQSQNRIDLDAGLVPLVSIGDRVWIDANRNGLQDAGETGMAGVVIDTYSSADSIIGNGDDVLKASTTTDASGNCNFANVPVGYDYYILFHAPTGYGFTTKDVGNDDSKDSDADATGKIALFSVNAGQNRADLDAGLIAVPISYVDASATGADDGTNWANAYKSLQTALAAAVPGKTIYVAGGTYKPTKTTDRTISFQLKSGVAICGGYAGKANANPDLHDVNRYPSTLSGDIGMDGYNSDNSYHVVDGSNTDTTAIMDGFTISGGNANGNVSPTYRGGGMYVSSGSPTVQNCVFSDNWASVGGGMYDNWSSPTLTNCAFMGNTAVSGAGMFNDSSQPTLTNCTFNGNTASDSGGGMYNSTPTFNATESSPILTDCTFNRNTANRYGGGMYSVNAAPPKLVNCSLTGNMAASGGGMYNHNGDSYSPPMLTNCTLSGNTASSSGGGIWNTGSSPNLINCIVWGNTATNGPQIYSPYNTTTISYSDVEGGWIGGTGNINTDPLFVRNPTSGPDGTWGTADDDCGDLRLRLTSPCVDVGSNTAVPGSITTDLGGSSRFIDMPGVHDPGAIVDMGAYEAEVTLSVGDRVWIDSNANGIQDAGETGLAGITVDLYSSADAIVGNGDDVLKASAICDANGNYEVTNVTVGPNYYLIFHTVTGFIFTNKDAGDDESKDGDANVSGITAIFTLVAGQNRTDLDAGLVAVTTIYVDAAASGTNNGVTWANAYTSLQSALAAATWGMDIRVAGGVYKPSEPAGRDATFTLESGVAVYGGYAGRANATNPDLRDVALYAATLSGDIGTVGVNSDNSYHVVVGGGTDSTAILDGFTITAGKADKGQSSGLYGGGIFNSGGSPTIRNCIISGNTAYVGGGMCSYSGSPTVINCTFSGNAVGPNGRGGGMYNCRHSSPALINCTLSGNTAGYGGGMCNEDSSSPTLTNCIFSRNSATYGGGGMYNSSSSPTLSNCTFSGNLTSSNGGGMFNEYSSPSLTNCAFSGNSSAAVGGGIAIFRSSSATLTNCTLSGNAANVGGAIYSDYSPTIKNCVLWGNTAGGGSQIYEPISTPSITDSDIQGGGFAGAGNINADPLFVRNPSPGTDGTWGTADDDYGDLHMQLTSPCIDAGGNVAVLADIATDLDGNPRFADVFAIPNTGNGMSPVVDMGAYEAFTASQTINGGSGNCEYSAGLSVDGTMLQVWTNAAGTGAPAYVCPIGTLTSLAINTAAGNDSLILDFNNGNPVPPGGVSLNAGTGTNTLTLKNVGSGNGITVSPSQVLVGTSAINLAGIGGVTLDAPANRAISLGALNLSAKLSLPAGKGLVLKTASLTISGAGLLDLADNDLIVPNGNLAAITDWLRQGRTNVPGTRWAGTAGIVSSEAAGNGGMTLAVGRPGGAVFDGQSVDANTVVVKYTVDGDADLNGMVDGDDYFLIDRGYAKGGSGYQDGDFDYSGTIDVEDYFLIDGAVMARGVELEPLTLALSPGYRGEGDQGEEGEVHWCAEAHPTNTVVGGRSVGDTTQPAEKVASRSVVVVAAAMMAESVVAPVEVGWPVQATVKKPGLFCQKGILE